MNFYKTIISALYPNTCVGCSEILKDEEQLCDYCYEMIERTSKDKLCLKCGLPKKDCDCSRFIFRFDGCVAPFYYKGIAKRIMYGFKFRRKEYLADFFAQQMALCVKQNYLDIRFDGISYVPMLKKSKIRRGYNQSRVLALKLSKIIDIPVYENLLGLKNKKYIQHKLPYKMRFDNVNEKYFCKYNILGKNILLVDDIKTSGATLDECSKQLLRSGANRVYCVTALITYNRKKKGNKNGN